MKKRRTVGLGVAGLFAAGVALVALGVYSQFGARLASVSYPAFPAHITGAGSQWGSRSLFFPGTMSMSTMRPFRYRTWPPGYATGKIEWQPPDVVMHSVKPDGSIVPSPFVVSLVSPSRPARIQIAATVAPGRVTLVMIHPAWLWGPGVAALMGCAGLVIARRRSRVGPNSCASCGYDLRGLREGAACPECGAAR